VIGLVLAAGAGRRLGGLTRDLPKTLLDVGAGRSILDRTLANLSAVGITDVAVITGFARHRIEERVDELQQRHGVTLELVVNERAEEWNNAYSLWLARDLFAQGAMLVNGDTVHPVQVEHSVLAARGPQLLIALDQEKPLAEEEMKVLLDDQGRVRRINKALDPAAAQGEYIGVTLIEPAAASPSPTRSRPPGGATPTCTTRTASRSSWTAAARYTPARSAPLTGWRSTHRRPGEGAGHHGHLGLGQLAGR
jgi:choline kinase